MIACERTGDGFGRPGEPNAWYKAAAGVSVAGALAFGIMIAPLAQPSARDTGRTEPGRSQMAKSDALRASLEALQARRERVAWWVLAAQSDQVSIGSAVAGPRAALNLAAAVTDAQNWLDSLTPATTVEDVEEQVVTAKMVEDRLVVRLGEYRDSAAVTP